MRRFLILSCVAWCLGLPGALRAQSLAFTFDDGFDSRAEPRADALNRQLLAALADRRVKSMLFPAGKYADDAAGRARVAAWSGAGHAIGNHTYAHDSLGVAQTTASGFGDDVMHADRLLADLPGWHQFLRFPYLKEGETVAKRDGFRAWMRDHGYRPAPVSIDTSDWYYSERYVQLISRGREDLVPAFKRAYLEHLWGRATYYDGLAGTVIGRSPLHVVLLHVNALNAACIGEVIDMFRAKQWTVIDPIAAFDDPLYAQEPQFVPAGESILWALAKDAGLPGLRYPGEEYIYEQPGLDALGF